MSVYYNEFDGQKAAWIRELIKAGVVADGEVDERPIQDVRAGDLREFRQCHFFAGIAVWSYALRLAGWPDDRECWTGSCPCPSFSVAGKGEGFDDPRHLWPIWIKLIRECRPGVVFGEQADGAIGHGWLDLVSGEMEAEGYAFAAAVLGAHSVGGPHRRQRLYFVGAQSHSDGYSATRAHATEPGGDEPHDGVLVGDGNPVVGSQSAGRRCTPGRTSESLSGQEPCGAAERSGDAGSTSHPSDSRRNDCGTGDGLQPNRAGLLTRREASATVGYGSSVDTTGGSLDGDNPLGPRLEGHLGHERDGNRPGWLDPDTARSVAEAGATRGFWAGCDWWYGRDGKYRPIEPGLQPLAHGTPERVVRLRGYGDAIVAPVAQAFIEAYLEAE